MRKKRLITAIFALFFAVSITSGQTSTNKSLLYDARSTEPPNSNDSQTGALIQKLVKEAFLPKCDKPTEPEIELLSTLRGNFSRKNISENAYLLRMCNRNSSWGGLTAPYQSVNGHLVTFDSGGKFSGTWSDVGMYNANIKDVNEDGLDDIFSVQFQGPQMGLIWGFFYIYGFKTDSVTDITTIKRIHKYEEIYQNNCYGSFPPEENRGVVKAAVVKLISRQPVTLQLEWYAAKCTAAKPEPPVNAFKFTHRRVVILKP